MLPSQQPSSTPSIGFPLTLTVEEGATYQSLLEDARRDMARHYLRQPELELNETAYLLGYEDPNSFIRAFHKWEGSTPCEWRQEHTPHGRLRK